MIWVSCCLSSTLNANDIFETAFLKQIRLFIYIYLNKCSEKNQGLVYKSL